MPSHSRTLDLLSPLIAGSPLTLDESRELVACVLEVFDTLYAQDRLIDGLISGLIATHAEGRLIPDKPAPEVARWWGRLAVDKDPELRPNLSPAEASAAALIARQSHETTATKALALMTGPDAVLRDTMRANGARDPAILVAVRQQQHSGRQRLIALASGERQAEDRGWLANAQDSE